MNVEKRRYRITSFREIPDSDSIRVLLVLDEPLTVNKKRSTVDILKDPASFAQNLMRDQVNQMIHDTFLISKTEYQKNKYLVGDHVIVTIEHE